MIRYALACDAGHRFDSWFSDSAAFDGLAAKRLVSCPSCGSTYVAKTIMAPAVTRQTPRAGGGSPVPPVPVGPPPPGMPARSIDGPLDDGQRRLRMLVSAMRSKVLAETQDVGHRFPEQARRMHDGDIPHRDIRGEATLEEARALLEDGIMILPVPGEPGELN